MARNRAQFVAITAIAMDQTIVKSVVGDADRATLTLQIESLLTRLRPAVPFERRHEDRVAAPVLFSLTPLDADHEPIESETTIVVGKNISRRGLSFYHERPMPHRRAIITLAHPGLGSFAAEIDVSWCRFTRPGWYESGGRLIRPVNPDRVLAVRGAGTDLSPLVDFGDKDPSAPGQECLM